MRQTLHFPFNFESHYEKSYHQSILAHLSALVERACRSPENKFGYGLWRNHILLVVRYAKLLAQQLGADEEVCEIAAILHDYAGVINFDYYENHHVHSARIAHDLLSKLEYPKEKIEHIKQCVISHRASRNIPRKTKEAHILASADAIAHVLAWESLLDLAIEEYQYSEDQAKSWVARKLVRSYQKIMPEALPLIEEKYKIVKLTLETPLSMIPLE